jgi:hypothetical protein
VQSQDKSRHYLKAAAIGGAVGGVLSAIPLVNLANCICCLWILTAGFLAVYLVQHWSKLSVTAGEGAQVGVMAGVAAGLVEFCVSLPFILTRRGVTAAQLERMPAEARQVVEAIMGGGGLPAILFAIYLVTGALFGTLGGLLGAAILGRED